jgi:hypothetical protein
LSSISLSVKVSLDSIPLLVTVTVTVLAKKLTNPAPTTSFTVTSLRIRSAIWGEREPMMSNELLRYFWRRRIWRGISPGRAAVCGVKVGWRLYICERVGRTFEYYLNAGSVKECLSVKSTEIKEKREEEKLAVSDAQEQITGVSTLLHHANPITDKQEARKSKSKSEKKTHTLFRPSLPSPLIARLIPLSSSFFIASTKSKSPPSPPSPASSSSTSPQDPFTPAQYPLFFLPPHTQYSAPPPPE